MVGWITARGEFRLPMGKWEDMDDKMRARQSAILPVISKGEQVYAWRWELSNGDTGWTEAFEHREIEVSHYFALPDAP